MRWQKKSSTRSATSSTSTLLIKYCQVSKVCIIWEYVDILKFSFPINLSMYNYFSVGAEVVNPDAEGHFFLQLTQVAGVITKKPNRNAIANDTVDCGE